MALSHEDIKYFELAVGSANIKKTTDVDISARCPHCSADEKWKNTSRLHLYTKGEVTNVNCFTGDCFVKNRTVYSYLRDFYPTLLEGYKRETFKEQFDNAVGPSNDSTDIFALMKAKKQKKILEDPVETSPVNFFDLTSYFDKVDVRLDAQEYIKSRGFDYAELQRLFGTFYIGNQDLKIDETYFGLTDNLIIPLYGKNSSQLSMYGFYSRSIHDKVFYTFNPENNFGFKVWNWFNVDLTKPVYIFEGIFDAISYAISSGNYNVIATMGAALMYDRVKELHPKSVFCLDDDKSGLVNMLKMAELGFGCFIQPSNINDKDMNELYKSGIDCDIMVHTNTYYGLSAEIEIKNKL